MKTIMPFRGIAGINKKMGTFTFIFIGIVASAAYSYGLKSVIKSKNGEIFPNKILDRLLGIGNLQILFLFIVCGLIMNQDAYNIDSGIDSLLDNSFLDSVFEFFTGMSSEPNWDAYSIGDKLKADMVWFILIFIVLLSVHGYGLATRSLSKFVVESLSVLCSFLCYLSFNNVFNIQYSIMRNSKSVGLLDFFSESSLFSSIWWFKPCIYLIFIFLIINHFLCHRALNSYYEGCKNANVSSKIKYITIAACIVVFVLYNMLLF